LADKQCQLYSRQVVQQLSKPQPGALISRRQITGLSAPRITKAHWNDGDTTFVVKTLAVDIHPFTQAIPAGVVPRDSGLMRLRARCLTNNE
jgi:hypothetical protein